MEYLHQAFAFSWGMQGRQICHCEGRLRPWQSRAGTADPYWLPLKWHVPIASVAALTAQPLAALPLYGCGVPFTGGERHAGWHYLRHKFIGARPPSLSFRGAKRRVNLLQSVTFSPRPTCYSTWYCEIATSAAPPRNDKSGSFRIPFQISVYYVLRAVY